MRQAAGAGLVGLGLIGGAGAVTYNDDGGAKVTITDKQGRKESITIGGKGGRTFRCPNGTEAKLEPIDLEAGRIKITVRHVRRSIRAIEKKYPGREAPNEVVSRFNRLAKRNDRLVDAYNDAIGRHNAIIDADCDPS